MIFIKKQLKNNKLISYLLLSLIVPLFFIKLGQGSLFSFDEAWHAEVARNILLTKKIFLLHFNGGPYLDKPQLGYWLIALSFRLFGINEWAARFPSALLGFLAVYLLYRLGSQMFNGRVGLLSAVMLTTSVWYILRARTGNLDTFLVFFILLTFLSALRIGRKKFYLYLCLSSFACLLLVKHWQGLGLLPIIIYYLLKNRKKIMLRELFLALVLFLVIISPYYIINFLEFGNVFSKFLIDVGSKGQTGALTLRYQLPLFYIHMGIREWYYPAVIAFLGNLFFLNNINIRLLYIYLLCSSFPLLTSEKTEIWHLIPLYPALGLMIFSFVDNFLRISIKILKLQRTRKLILVILFFLAGLGLAGKQVKEFWVEVIGTPRGESAEALLSKRASQFSEPLFLTDYYFPVAIFYSKKKVHYVGPKQKYLGVPVGSLRELFDKIDNFVLLTTDNVLGDNKISNREYTVVAQEENKLLIYHQSKKTTDLSVDELLSLRGNFCRAGQLHSFDVKLDEKIPRALPVELHKQKSSQ